MTYIVETENAHDAISFGRDIEVLIDKVTNITENQIRVETNIGNFVCESFEDADANVYMKVYELKGSWQDLATFRI